MRPFFALAVIALALATPAAADQEDTRTVSDSIVVTGRRAAEVEESARAFVRGMAAHTDDHVARWDSRICPGVVGLRREQAQFIADRIAQRAISIGLRVAEPGCRANVLVFTTSHAEEFAQALVRDFGIGLGQNNAYDTLGSDALADFTNTQRPVRWWYVSNTFTSDGERILNGNPPSNRPDRSDSVNLRGTIAPPWGASRLRRGVHQNFAHVIIIVDSERVVGRQIGTLADYVSFVALAQIDPRGDASGYPSILNGFSGSTDAPTQLTEWDEAYLRAVYAADRDARSGLAQDNEIVEGMARDMTSANGD